MIIEIIINKKGEKKENNKKLKPVTIKITLLKFTTL